MLEEVELRDLHGGMTHKSYTPLRNIKAEEAARELPQHRQLNELSVPGVNFALAIEETQKTLSLIYNRYECHSKLGESFMLIQQNILGSDWDLIKFRFVEKILTEQGARFLMVFGGSSVTAGHDNGINVSFPLIVQKRMEKALAAAGVDLQVHNIAQGANNCLPSNLCYESMGGHDPDFVAWEQSFNCGRDDGIYEIATRFAAWSKTPGSVYFSNSGSVNPTACNKSEFKKPWSDEDWTPDMEGLPEWKPTEQDVSYWKERNNFAHTKAGSTSQRFGGRSYVYREYGVAVLGADLWGTYKGATLCDDAPEMKGLACSPEVFYDKCLMKMMRKEAAAYGFGRGARHHPGKGMHQARGEIIAFLYSLIFLDALYSAQRALQGAAAGETIADIRSKFAAERAKLVTTNVLRAPVVCGGYYCELKPHCYTNYHSHFAEDLFLTDQMVGPLNWETDVQLPDKADKIFHESRHGFHSKNSSDGGMHLKINIGKTKFVVVCFYHYPNAIHAMEYYLEPNVASERLNAQYQVDKTKVLNWEKDVSEEWGVCQKVHNLPEGQHVLGIRFKPNEKNGVAGLTHFITWD